MNKIQLSLQEELQSIKSIIQKTFSRTQSSPSGKIDIVKSKGEIPRYRLIKKNPDTNKRMRQYISDKDMDLIKALVQKGFDDKILSAAINQEKTIERFLRNYDPEALKRIYANLSEERKALVESDVIDNETFIINWESVTYSQDDSHPIDTEFYTIRNEHVRSKSEKIIADTLFQRRIPYRYEPPTTIIPGRKPWRPDFVVLNPYTCVPMIWEHLGMMDDPDYCRSNLKKIRDYQKAGFFQGDKIIFSLESSDMPLSTIDINLIIDKYFDTPGDVFPVV